MTSSLGGLGAGSVVSELSSRPLFFPTGCKSQDSSEDVSSISWLFKGSRSLSLMDESCNESGTVSENGELGDFSEGFGSQDVVPDDVEPDDVEPDDVVPEDVSEYVSEDVSEDVSEKLSGELVGVLLP